MLLMLGKGCCGRPTQSQTDAHQRFSPTRATARSPQPSWAPLHSTVERGKGVTAQNRGKEKGALRRSGAARRSRSELFLEGPEGFSGPPVPPRLPGPVLRSPVLPGSGAARELRAKPSGGKRHRGVSGPGCVEDAARNGSAG